MRVRRFVPLVLSVVGCLTAAGCGGDLPVPRHVEPPASAFVPVPYPPPAALAEVVPPKPPGSAVWVDGSWAWRGRSYVWQRGGWIRPPTGARFAPWRLRYLRDGTLLFAESTWYDPRGYKLEEPTPVVAAYTPPNEFTPESQTAR